MTEEQTEWYRELVDGVRTWASDAGWAASTAEGDLIGPFNVFAHNPLAGRAYMSWVLIDQRESTLPARLREVAILTVGAVHGSAFEIYAHSAIAAQAGLAGTVVDDIVAGRPPKGLTPAERAAHRFTLELSRDHEVAPGTYREAYDRLGRQGLLDLVNVVSAYVATAATLNAFAIPAPGATDG